MEPLLSGLASPLLVFVLEIYFWPVCNCLQKVCDWEEGPAGFKPKSDEDGISKSRQAKLKEELEAINREIERKKRTQAARV